ncbi:MAG: cupredoxin domain-containing protein [Chloroflexia bacterium]|nr:cupredoxin domain-containing protein [Chloroflexia bacterium]
MREKHVGGAETVGPRRFDRRRFLGFGAMSIAGAGALAITSRGGTAHDDHGQDGGTPQASPAASPAATPVASGGDYVVNAIDLAFEPKAFTIPAHTGITLQVMNSGMIPHDVTIDQLDVKSDLLSGGESTTVTINAAPGTYQFYCSVPGHKQAGMTGTLTVE